MDAPQMLKQIIPADSLRLADLALQAGPREIEFEIELPKGGEWDLDGPNRLDVTSSNPSVLAPGEVSFEPVSMRFMVPVSAVQPGEVVLTYDIRLAWRDKDGRHCTDENSVVQKVIVERSRGATVPWVHYKAQPARTEAAGCGPVED